MKRFLIATALIAGFAGAAFADEPAPPAGPPPGAPGPWGMGPHGHGPMMPPPFMDRGMRHDHDMFGLFGPTANKNLTPADVKIIAEGILLEHGNHDWTVANVGSANNAIDFSFESKHGDVIATFSVDPATGRMKRLS
jgi:hypothetical protein